MNAKHLEYFTRIEQNTQKSKTLLSRVTLTEGWWTPTASSAELDCFCWDDDRESKLSEAAAVFGTDGWIASMAVSRDEYNWKKIVDGVTITIYSAKTLPPLPKELPVASSEFPLQLL